MESEPAPVLLRVEDAARSLAISRTIAYREIASGRLRSVLIGHSRRVPVEALDEYVASLASSDGAS